MIEKFELMFGSSATAPHLMMDAGVITVFVGPNNSGKSLILREIEERARNNSGSRVILRDLQLKTLSDTEIDSLIAELPVQSTVEADGSEYLDFEVSDPVRRSQGGFRNRMDDRVGIRSQISYLRQFSVLRLDGNQRLQILNPSETHSLGTPPQSVLGAIFSRDQARERLRSLVHDAFDLYFTVDPTELRVFRARLASRPPTEIAEERGLDKRSIDYHRSGRYIEEFGDGVRAYCGILATVLCAGFRVILLDEPEAFLHPSLSRRLGKELVRLAAQRAGNVIAATHSSDFLMGCIQAGKPLNIVRLTYDHSSPTARLLPSNELRSLVKEPLVRSTGVLSALFHRGAVVCEGDIDRTLYEEINERLRDSGEGMSDALFLNAIGKQTVRKIIEPLRKIGVPAAAVVDLDILKEGDLAALLRGASVPQPIIESLVLLKGRVLEKFRQLSVEPKIVGIDGLDSETRSVAMNLIARAAEYGVFIVPVGEVEKWLAPLNVPGKKTAWLIAMFDELGDDPDAPSYRRPGDGDIWQFVRDISKWVITPAAGMPT